MNESPASNRNSRFAVLTLAVAAGLLTGLGEGVSFLLLQSLGWWDWSMAEHAVTSEILWIAPVFDFLLFSAIGLVFLAIDWKRPSMPLRRIAAAGFILLLSVDWLMSSGRIRQAGAGVLGLGIAVTVYRKWDGWGQPIDRAARRAWPVLAALTLLLFAGVQGRQWYEESSAVRNLRRPASPAARPNVLVVVIDTLRADHVSAYGYPRATTPTLDRLAREGALFERAFASTSWTLPSHVSLLTGRYCFEHGAEINHYDGRFATIADVMRENGYRTGAFSANTIWFTRRRGLGRGFIHFEDYFNTLADMAFRTLYGRKFKKLVLVPLGYSNFPARKSATQITDAMLRWVDRDPEVPFFAFLTYFDVHDPYLPPDSFRTKFSTMKNPGGLIDDYILRTHPKMSAEQLQGEVDAYDGALLYADREIGRLLGELESRGKMQNTLVVVTADHGEFFGEHDLFMHRNALYRQGVQVPLIFSGKGWGIRGGTRVSLPVSNVSVPATILDALGIRKESSDFPVPSLETLWGPAAPAEWPMPLMEIARMPFAPLVGQPAYEGRIKSLVTPQEQYIIHEKYGEELYDWQEDPRQEKNLARDPAFGPLVGSLRQKMLEMLRQSAIFDSLHPSS